MGARYCPTPSLRPAAAGLRGPLVPQVPLALQDPWVPLDLLAPQGYPGVLDTRDPQALLDPKESQATQDQRAKEEHVGSLAPKASQGIRENLAPKETLVRRATGGRGCTSYARL